jgi:hypothetical protein
MKFALLRCASRLVLAKNWKRDGSIEPAAKAAWFEAREIQIEGLADLLELFAWAEARPRVCLVKEAIATGANPKRLRRRCEAGVDKRTDEAYPAGLRVVPRDWIVLDVEKLPRPAAIDWRDGDACAAYVRSKLPKEFRNAACVWQFSGSSGHPSKRDEVRLHLLFMLDVAVQPQPWKGYFAHLPFVDESAFDKAKIIFTAAPVIEAGADPIAQRSGILDGEPVVCVPAEVKACSARIARGDDGKRRVTAHVASAPMPEAAAAFVEIVAKSNILRSHHPAYRSERSRRLAFCGMLRATFGIQDEGALEDAFYKACVGEDDPNAEDDAEQSLEWARGESPSGRTFSVRKLLCNASVALCEADNLEMARRAARLATIFDGLEKEPRQ